MPFCGKERYGAGAICWIRDDQLWLGIRAHPACDILRRTFPPSLLLTAKLFVPQSGTAIAVYLTVGSEVAAGGAMVLHRGDDLRVTHLNGLVLPVGMLPELPACPPAQRRSSR